VRSRASGDRTIRDAFTRRDRLRTLVASPAAAYAHAQEVAIVRFSPAEKNARVCQPSFAGRLFGRVEGKEPTMLKGFKQFLLRGNVVDLAVAVVIGGAFGAVVAALVKDLLTPLIAAVVGQPDFSAIVFTVNGSKFLIGDFINAVVSFVMVAAAIYVFVVTPMNMITERRRRGEAPADPTTKKCPECLSEVAIAARRCAFCTQPLPAGR
jgi:large conductance mechanosensitive channel